MRCKMSFILRRRVVYYRESGALPPFETESQRPWVFTVRAIILGFPRASAPLGTVEHVISRWSLFSVTE